MLSHYERIRRHEPDIAGRAFNEARTGARMAAAPEQARRAVEQRAEYVTVLLGANDLCAASPAAMTPTAEFRAQFEAAMRTLHAGLPRARVFVSSIPDPQRLFEVKRADPAARAVWAAARICPSVLAPERTDAERARVAERQRAYYAVLADVCGRYARCRWDGGATYAYRFTAADISRLDHFHPSLRGQAALARTSWRASWWPGL